jgi:hypothetical protein
MSYSADGSGEGPERAVFRVAAQHLLENQINMGLWQENNGWLVPRLSPMEDGPQSPERILEFRLAGALFALHTIVLRLPVAKVSPHVFLSLLCGHCPPNYDYLQIIDPSAASIMAPWFEYVDKKDPQQSDNVHVPASSVRHLLAEYLGEPVCFLGFFLHRLCHAHFLQISAVEGADRPLLNQYTVALWNMCLFGRRSIKSHPEWLAFVSGFQLNGVTLSVRAFLLCYQH